MPVASFKISHMQQLLDELGNATTFEPDNQQLFEGSNYPNNIVVDTAGRKEIECDAKDVFFEPSVSKMLAGSIKPKLIIVGHSEFGLYCVTNASVSENSIVHAIGCDPQKDEEWLNEKTFIYGKDGSTDIPFQWVKVAILNKAKTLDIDFTANGDVHLVHSWAQNTDQHR